LLASARPNLGAVGQGRCTPTAGGRGGVAPTSRTRRRCSRRPGGKAHGDGGGAPGAGEDGVEQEDGEKADNGGPAAWRGARASADFGRPASAENPVGQRTGAAAECGGRGG
jgi:hypothetical protein